MTFQHRSFSCGRRRLVVAVAGMALIPPGRGQRARTARIGWLGWVGAAGASASASALAAFRAGLTDRGWTEGRDYELLVRDGDRPRSAELAGELIRSDVDLLVAQGPMVFGAKTVSGTRPVIFNIGGDPVEAGLVDSLSRPGGYLTGLTSLSTELAGKRLELLKMATPRGTHVAVIANALHAGFSIERDAVQAAARQLGLILSWHPLKSSSDLETALPRIASEGANALLAVPDTLINGQAQVLAKFTSAQRLPSMSGWAAFVEAGNLMSYGPNVHGYYRQMAAIADRLLRGARAADLAVEQPRDIELVVNAKVARALRLALPAELQLRADRWLE